MNVEYSFEIIINRLKNVLGVEKDSDLARKLGVQPNKFGTWKTRNFLPIELIAELCDKNNISINFILYGKGLKTLAITERKPLTMEEEMEKIELQRDLLGSVYVGVRGLNNLVVHWVLWRS